MTIIKASCPICGDVELTPEQIRCVVSSIPERSFYAFTCPTCNDVVRKPATDEVVRLLTLGGLVPERVVVPGEALEEHFGPTLTWDDVLDFGAWLDGVGDVVSAVTGAGARQA